jgi:hypothetical protein
MCKRYKKYIVLLVVATITIVLYIWGCGDSLRIDAEHVIKVEYIQRWGDGTEDSPVELPEPIRGKVLNVLSKASTSPLVLLFKKQYAMSGDLKIYYENDNIVVLHIFWGERVVKEGRHYGVDEPILQIISTIVPSATQPHTPIISLMKPSTTTHTGPPASTWP